jgi:DNA repair exonuclease SbcCD ATPase subunit
MTKTQTKRIPDVMDISSLVNPLVEATAAVEQAQDVIAKLERKRAACVRRGTEWADERAATALEAHTGNKAARQRLDEINTALATHASELASFDAALVRAGEQLAAAQAAKAREQDCEQACEQRSAFSRLARAGVAADEALAALVEASHEIHEAMDALHAAGPQLPRAHKC